MIVALSVHAAIAQPHDAILATLPNRFWQTTGDADVRIIEKGNVAGAASVLADGTTLVFLADPAALTPEAFDTVVAAAADRPIGFSVAAASALSDEALALLTEATDDAPFLVDCVGETVGDDEAALRTAVFEQLILVDTIAGPITGAALLHRDRAQIVARLDLGSGWTGVRLTARRTQRVRFALHAVSHTHRRTVEILPEAHATPAQVAIHDSKGTRIASPLYQGGYRRSWIDLHAAATGEAATSLVSVGSVRRALAALFTILGEPR
jgi:hypothetical protein